MGWTDAPEVKANSWQSAPENGPPVVATTQDGGKVYRLRDGSLAFSSPGMSTTDPVAIAQIMKGATPADASVYASLAAPSQGMTAARSGMQGMTIGGSDEITAAGASMLGPRSYDAELQRERMRLARGRDENPGTALTSEIAGAVLSPANALAPGAGGAGVMANVGRGAATGAALGGAYGFLSGEGGAESRGKNALLSGSIGLGAGVAIPAIAGVGQRMLDGIAARQATKAAAAGAPSTEALRAAGNAAYKAVEDAGVVVRPEAFSNAASSIVNNMAREGMDTGLLSLTPKSTRVADLLTGTGAAGKPVSLSELDILRRKAGVAAGDVTNRVEQNVGSTAISGLDDFINNLDQSQVTAGNTEGLPQLLGQAREIWAKMRRSQMIDDAIENAGTYLSGEASGIRNQFARILRNPKLSRGFSEAEQAAMKRVVNGSLPEQALNLISGGMGQLGTMAGAGSVGALLGSSLGPLGTVLGTVAGSAMGAAGGAIARKASERVANSNAEIVRGLIANGGLKALPPPNDGARALIEQLLRGSAAAGPNTR